MKWHPFHFILVILISGFIYCSSTSSVFAEVDIAVSAGDREEYANATIFVWEDADDKLKDFGLADDLEDPEEWDEADQLAEGDQGICLVVDDEVTRSMFLAVVEDDVQKFENALNDGANILTQDKYGQTVLHHAVYRNSTQVAEYVLEKAPQLLHIPTAQEVDAFILAVAYHHANLLKLFAEKGADVNREYKGQKFLERANGDWDATKFLLQSGVNPNITLSTGKPFISSWIQRECDSQGCHVRFIDILDIVPVDLSMESSDGKTLCSELVVQMSGMGLEELIKKVGACKWGKYDHQTMLSGICSSYPSSQLELYLNGGLIPLDKNQEGQTVLHCAAQSNRKDWVKKMLETQEGRALADEVDNKGLKPATAALLYGNSEVVDVFVGNGFQLQELSPDQIRGEFKKNSYDWEMIKCLAKNFPDYITDPLASNFNGSLLEDLIYGVEKFDYLWNLIPLKSINEEVRSMVLKLLIDKNKIEKIKEWVVLDPSIMDLKLKSKLHSWSESSYRFPIVYALAENKNEVVEFFAEQLLNGYLAEQKEGANEEVRSLVLQLLIDKNQTEKIKAWIELDPSIVDLKFNKDRYLGFKGFDPFLIFYALNQDKSDLFDIFAKHLPQGFFAEKRDSEGRTILLYAVDNQDVALVQKILSLDASIISIPSSRGKTPIAVAFMQEDRVIYDLLLNYSTEAYNPNPDEIRKLLRALSRAKDKSGRLIAEFSDYIDDPSVFGDVIAGGLSILERELRFSQNRDNVWIDYLLGHVSFSKIRKEMQPVVLKYVIENGKDARLRQWLVGYPEIANINLGDKYFGAAYESPLLCALKNKQKGIADLFFPLTQHDAFATGEFNEGVLNYLLQVPFDYAKINYVIEQLTTAELQDVLLYKHQKDQSPLDVLLANLDCNDVQARKLFEDLHSIKAKPNQIKTVFEANLKEKSDQLMKAYKKKCASSELNK